jgi:hypothetical protein
LNYFDQSSGLTGQPQTGVTDSDKGPVLEPIQDISTEDTLAESSKQARPHKAMEDVADAILIEQSNSQKSMSWIPLLVKLNDLLNKPIFNQLRYNLYFLVPCSLLQDTAHHGPSGDFQ